MHNVNAAGARIPSLGFGTWDLRGNVARDMVRAVLDRGYRHIDTAVAYDNEREVGEGLRLAAVPREEIFLTTKIWPTDFAATDFERAATASLARLGTDYVDLLLLHWPNPGVPLADTLGALARVQQKGLARHVGVSNFTIALLGQAQEIGEVTLAVNQVEYHPILAQDALLERLRESGIALGAYCPIARGRVFETPLLEDIATRHGKNPAQVALRWLVQQPGVYAIPRSSRVVHAMDNLEVFDFELDAAEMASITSLTALGERCVPSNGPFTPDWD